MLSATLPSLAAPPPAAPSCPPTGLAPAGPALDAREKLYHDLLAHSQALICTHDLQGRLIASNPATAALLGRPLAALPGLPLHKMTLPRHRAEVSKYLSDLTATGSQRGVLTLVGRSGQRRHVLFDSCLVREEGQLPYAISHGHDITERLQAEQQLLHAKLAAEAAVLAREKFLANMSHEMRTPLNGVLGRPVKTVAFQAIGSSDNGPITSAGRPGLLGFC